MRGHLHCQGGTAIHCRVGDACAEIVTVNKGVCNVNGQLLNANALDLDGLIHSSDHSRYADKCQV